MEKCTRTSFFLLILWSCLFFKLSSCQLFYPSFEDENLLGESSDIDLVGQVEDFIDILTTLNESVLDNCGSNGRILSIAISSCARHPCVLYAGQELTLEYTFVPDVAFEKLDFQLNLIEVDSGVLFPVKFTEGRGTVQADFEIESFARVPLNTTIPDGKMWYMEIVRSFEAKEICAKFIVSIINNLPTTTTAETTTEFTTESTTETTEEEPDSTTTSPLDEITSTDSSTSSSDFTSSSSSSSSTETVSNSTSTTTESSAFECEAEGLFGDPVDCTIFHQCVRLIDGSYSDSVFHCPQFTVWCQEILRCEFSVSCPCERSLLYY